MANKQKPWPHHESFRGGKSSDHAYMDIKLSSNDDESHRKERLNRIIGYVEAVSFVREVEILISVASLHDCKGHLTITWRHEPSDISKQAFEFAWCYSGIGDGGHPSDAITHEIDTRATYRCEDIYGLVIVDGSGVRRYKRLED